MKWLLLVMIYGACSEPVLTNTGREFPTEQACFEWARANKPQLGIAADMQIHCVPKITAK
jgi:hypothetical protein